MNARGEATPDNPPEARPPAGWTGRRALSETALVNMALLGIGAVTGIITARILGPQGRGALALALAVAGVLSVVAGLGLQQALAYRVAARRDELAQATTLSLWAGILAGGLVAGIAYLVAELVITDRSTADPVDVALVTVPISVVAGNLTGVLQGMRARRPFNLLRLALPACFAGLLVAGVAAGLQLSPTDIVVMYLVAMIAAAVMAVAFVRSALDLRRLPSRHFIHATLRYGLIVNVGALAWTANKTLALVVLAAVTTLKNVGLYSVAIGYAAPVGIAALALALHTLPDMAAEKDRVAQARLARRRLGATMLTTLPLTAAGVLAAPLLVPLAFGDEFSGAVAPAMALVIGQALLGVSHVLSEISRGLGKPGLPAVAEGLGATASVLLLPAVVPAFGLLGAAVSSVVVYLGVCLILYFKLRGRLAPGPVQNALERERDELPLDDQPAVSTFD